MYLATDVASVALDYSKGMWKTESLTIFQVVVQGERLSVRHFHCVIANRVVILGVWRPFGRRTGRASEWPCPLCLIWPRWDTVDREIIIPNLLYYNNFSYYCLPTWSCGGWQSRWLPTEVHWRPFDPSNLPCAVNKCPFNSWHEGLLGISGRRPAPQTTLIAGRPPFNSVHVCQRITTYICLKCNFISKHHSTRMKPKRRIISIIVSTFP